MLWRLFSSTSIMCSACVVCTRFILNQCDWIGGSQDPQNSPWLRPCTAECYLEQPRPELAIKHDVEAENLEADTLGGR